MDLDRDRLRDRAHAELRRQADAAVGLHQDAGKVCPREAFAHEADAIGADGQVLEGIDAVAAGGLHPLQPGCIAHLP